MTESRYRIFAADIPHGVGPPRPLQAQRSQDAHPSAPLREKDLLLDEVSRILDGQPDVGESVQRTFDRKESELRAFFDQLAHDDRAVVYTRLVAGNADDAMVAKLARLSSERRQRLVASLTDIPRRRTR